MATRIVAPLTLSLVLLLSNCVSGTPTSQAYSNLGPIDHNGTLPDGTEYRIRIPGNWTGTLVNDLDAVPNLESDSERARSILQFGYGYSGTSRRADRNYHFDPSAERDQQAQVVKIFSKKYGQPGRIIQFGCSGGGGVALGVAETYPDLFDGAISSNGGEGIVMSNQRLDLLFALKALIAPDSDLPLVGISYEDSDAASEAWATALAKVQSTDEGRAKILLAGALSQAPRWGGAEYPYLEEPDPLNATAVLEAMIRSVTDGAVYSAGIRYLYDNPAGVMSWNNDIDYRQFYHTAERFSKEIVEKLYKKANLSIDADLNTVNAHTRVDKNETALSYWEERALTGNPKVPVLQVNTIGDSTRSSALMAAYAAGVDANGQSSLYRQALISAAGHCTWNATEIIATLEVMSKRVETGHWGCSTSPVVLNEIGQRTKLGDPRFIDPGRLTQHNNREFFAE